MKKELGIRERRPLIQNKNSSSSEFDKLFEEDQVSETTILEVDESQKNIMKCIECDMEITFGEKFCKYCGTPVDSYSLED